MADIQKNAAWLQAAFERRRFRTRLLENKGKPLVFAEHLANRPGRKSVLFYLHFDGQPVIPSQWSQKDPWHPVVKRRGADGKWSEVEASQLLRADFDAELRIFGRSSSDDKGPILMFLTACDLLASRKLEPAINVKVILDSEEEVNSPGIASVVAANAALLRADALVIDDGPAHSSGRPTLVFGNRGLVPVTLTVFGPRTPLHSGHYGNYVPNPAQRLAALLATMKDEQGRVTVAGYYDGTKLTPQDRTVLGEVPDDEKALMKRVGIAEPERSARRSSNHFSIRRSTCGASRPRASQTRLPTSSLTRPSPSSICAPPRRLTPRTSSVCSGSTWSLRVTISWTRSRRTRSGRATRGSPG